MHWREIRNAWPSTVGRAGTTWNSSRNGGCWEASCRNWPASHRSYRTFTTSSIRAVRRHDEVREGADDNCALHRQVPVLQILDVAGDPVLNIGIVSRFAAEPANLGQAGDARFHERTHMVVRHQLRELVVVLDQ